MHRARVPPLKPEQQQQQQRSFTSSSSSTPRHAGGGGHHHRSDATTLVALCLLLAFTTWCYRGLKHRAQLQRPTEQERLQELRWPDAAAAAEDAGPLPGLQPSSAAGPAAGEQGAAPGAGPLPGPARSGFLFSWGLSDAERLGRQDAESAAPALALPGLEASAVAASRHTLLVTSGGQLWSFGPGDSAGGGGHGSKPLHDAGQLGRPGGRAPAPLPSAAFQGQAVLQVAAGRYHSCAVTADGAVYTSGLSDWGQLGRAGPSPAPDAAAADSASEGSNSSSSSSSSSSSDSSRQPPPHFVRDERLPHHRSQRRLAAATPDAGAAGGGGAAQATAAGTAAAGACTSGWSCHDGRPGRVAELAHVRVVAVAAGRYSSLAVDAQGRLWTWGYDACATGGALPAQHEAWRPRLVGGALAGQRVVAADVGYTFWLAVTADGSVWTCDHGDDGYAGTMPSKRRPNHAGQLGRAGPPSEPGLVGGALAGQRVVAVAAGREHALVATADGRVFSWGGGSAAVLGRSGRGEEPGLVAGALAGEAVTHVAAGEYFSLAASQRRVWAWGSAAYNCTGTRRASASASASGNSAGAAEVPEPAPVDGLLGSGQWRIHALAAGYQHALAIAVPSSAAEAAHMRAEARAAAPPRGAAVEVVLTAQQAQAQHQALAVAAAAGRGNTTSRARRPPAPARHTSYLAQQPAPPTQPAHDAWAAWRPTPWHEQLARLAGDVFAALPAQLSAQHKNPCFAQGQAFVCLPFFYIIGVSKSGTTDLYHRLALHADIVPATNKGPHFWDECPFPPKPGACAAGESGDFQGFLSLFARAADTIRGAPSTITGEASSNTFTSANGIWLRGFRGAAPWASWAGAAGANATMPALLREAQPYARLILMLRNPVTRYHSAYYYYRWWLKGAAEEPPPSADAFHEHALADMAAWHACVANASGRALDCVRRFEQQQLIKGMYADFLPDWQRHWPREQLLVLRFEDYSAALPEHLAAVLRFLGVPQPDEDIWDSMLAAPVRNRKRRPAMRADTRAALDAFFAPANQRLAAALGGDERWLWRDGDPAADEAAAAA